MNGDGTIADKEHKELFTDKVAAGRRSYFFDVKESTAGTKYLVISETREGRSGPSHNRVMVFEKHVKAFNEGLRNAIEFLGVKNKGYNLDRIKRQFPKAYEQWTPDEDEKLKKQYAVGLSIPELAAFFQGQKSAIRSRLTKLGVLPIST